MDADEDFRIINEALESNDFDTVASHIIERVPEPYRARILALTLRKLDYDHQSELLRQEKDHIDTLKSIV